MDFYYKKSGTIFNMHSYWTKQPVDPIIFFINKYSKIEDSVLDPFSGTGMTGIAAIKNNRKCILNDLSPISIHISKGYCTNYNIEKNLKKITEVKKRVLKDIEDRYITKCFRCGSLVKVRFSIVGEVWESLDGKIEENRGEIMLNKTSGSVFNKDFKFKEFRLIRLCYECKCTKGKQQKKPDKEDIAKWMNNDYKKFFYPQDAFFGQEPKRNYKKGIHKVYQLYSCRNLSSLSLILDRIKNISDNNIKQLFLFIFTSILFNSSLMSRYRDYENTSIKMGTLYVPPLIKDTNVASNFENKLNLIIKGNSEIFNKGYKNKVEFINGSADNMKKIPGGSVGYIYADPPYSDVISYSELNIVYESWLGSKTNNKNEMIVSKNHGKDIFDYSKKFSGFLDESFRVLKKGGVLTLVFHHPNAEHWQQLQEVIVKSKFEPIVSRKPIRLISNSKTSSQHKTQKRSQCFLVFNLRKVEKKKNKKLKEINSNLISKINKESEKLGYIKESDKFDYLINKLIFTHKIDQTLIN